MPPDHQPIFVYWRSVRQAQGREIRLDAMHRIITIVPIQSPIIGLSTAETIIRDTGGVHFRTTAGGRQPMPAFALRLRLQERAKDFSGPLAHDSENSCVVCDTFSLQHLEPIVQEPSDLYICMVCTHCWHMDCARAFKSDCLPVNGQQFVCAACKAA